MERLYLLVVDDQREVRSSVAADLRSLTPLVVLEECESAQEASEVLEDLLARGRHVALLISDHVMPGQTGVSFLTEVQHDERFRTTRKLLLTGLATHKDTIDAINQAKVDAYVEKPWDPAKLLLTVKQLLTGYVLAQGLDTRPYMAVLDSATLIQAMRTRGADA